MAHDKDRYDKRLAALKNRRSSYDGHWRELGENILPRRMRFDRSTNRGSKKSSKIINNTATRAARILASGLMAGLTSPSRPWFRLAAPSPELTQAPGVRQYLGEVERIIREVFARTNIYNALHSVYGDEAVFNTSSMFIEQDSKEILRAVVFPIGSYYLTADDFGRVNGIYRETSMTVAQLVRRFGEDKVSPQVKALFDNGELDVDVDLVHLIEPNDDRENDAFGMPWRSVWYEQGTHGREETDGLLRVGGFEEFPTMCPRWQVSGEEVYGSGPGMEALGDIKMLQKMELRGAQAMDKIVMPPMTGPPGIAAEGNPSILSGAMTVVPATAAGQKFEPAHTVDPKVLQLQEKQDRVEMRINSTFYADLFLMFAQIRSGQMTAREVDERHEEKVLQLGPAIERLEDELLDPLIDRTFAILNRFGMLPPAPPELQGVDLRVEYISVLAQAQKLIEVLGVERFASYIMQYAEAQPEVLDKFNFDESADQMGELLGVKPSLIRSNDEAKQIREKRAEAQQAQMQAEQAKAARDGAAAVKDLSQTPVGEPDTALQQMIDAAGGPA